MTKARDTADLVVGIDVDASGNLLVGKTALSIATEGCYMSAGQVSGTKDSGIPALFNRNTTDGTIIDLRKDGATVGSIGNLSTSMYISGSTGQVGLLFNGSAIEPMENGSRVDNTKDLGSSTYRFNDLLLGGGVFLGGTAAANYLDDYEEGTWTPTLNGSTTSNFTYGFADGEYTKIGNLVTVTFGINISSKGTSSGTLYLSGLPFTVADKINSTTLHGGTGVGYFGGVAAAISGLSLTPEEGTLNVYFRHVLAAGSTTVATTNLTDISDTFQIRSTFSYFTT